MKKKICFLRIILLIMFAGMVTLADDIKIPSCHTEDSLLYLANRLGLNIIYTNFTNCNSKRFYSEAKDIENIISEYQSQNSEILKLEYLKEKNTIICYNNDSEIFLKKLLLSNIIIESGEKIIALLDDQLQIKLNVIFHEKYFPQKGNLAFKYFKDHSSSSVYEILSAFFGDGGQYSVKTERICSDFYFIVECIHEHMDFTHHQPAHRERHGPHARLEKPQGIGCRRPARWGLFDARTRRLPEYAGHCRH